MRLIAMWNQHHPRARACWLILLFLVGCSPVMQTPYPTIFTLTPTATQIITTISLTPQLLLTPVSTASFIPAPTITRTPRPSFTPLSPTPTKTPTLDICFKAICSPDGKYIAKPTYKKDGYVNAIEIMDRDGKVLWTIPSKLENQIGAPQSYLDIKGWSKDSRYLYFCYVFFPDGGDFAYWWDGFDLQRLDVHADKIESILPGDKLAAFAFSPDDTLLAYTRSQDKPSIIYIRNLSTGVVKSAYVLRREQLFKRVTGIFWSPSGNGLVFHTEGDGYQVQTVYLNVESMQQKVIKKYVLTALWFDSWIDDNKLKFSNYDHEILVADINSNEIIIVGTATSEP